MRNRQVQSYILTKANWSVSTPNEEAFFKAGDIIEVTLDTGKELSLGVTIGSKVVIDNIDFYLDKSKSQQTRDKLVFTYKVQSNLVVSVADFDIDKSSDIVLNDITYKDSDIAPYFALTDFPVELYDGSFHALKTGFNKNNVTISSNADGADDFTRINGVSEDWGSAEVTSKRGFVGDGFVSTKITAVNTYLMFGLTDSPKANTNTKKLYGDINYAAFLNDDNTLISVYESGTSQALSVQHVTYKIGDTIKVAREGTDIKYYHISGDNSQETLYKTTSGVSANTKLYLDAVLYSNNSALEDVVIRQRVENIVDVVGSPTPITWSVNEVPSDQAAFKAGDIIEVTLTMNEKLILNDASTSKLIIGDIDFYLDVSKSDPDNGVLVFTYQVQSGIAMGAHDFDIDEKYDIVLNGITDIDDNTPNFTDITTPVLLFIKDNPRALVIPNKSDTTFTATGAIITNGNDFAKDPEETESWSNTEITSNKGFIGNGFVIAEIASLNSRLMFGLTNSPKANTRSDNRHVDIQYAAYLTGTNTVNAWNIHDAVIKPDSAIVGQDLFNTLHDTIFGGTAVKANTLTYKIGDRVKIAREGTNINYYLIESATNKETLYKTVAGINADDRLYLDVALYSNNSVLKNVSLYQIGPVAVDAIAPDAVDLDPALGVQDTSITTANKSQIEVGAAFSVKLPYVVDTDIKSIKIVLGGMSLDVENDILVLDTILDHRISLRHDAHAAGVTIGASGLEYAYTTSNKTLVITKTSGVFASADIVNVVEGVKLMNTHQNIEDGIRTATITYIDAAGNQSVSATATLSVGIERGFRINGGNSGDYAGYSVSSAGDVNGDGLDDFIVGAYGKDASAGTAYVIYGKLSKSAVNLSAITAQDLTTVGKSGFAIYGKNAGDQSGYSVSSAGDVNGDGFSDVIVGANGANRGNSESYVVFGKANNTNIHLSHLGESASANNGFVISGGNMSAITGYSVSSAGDVNGDGLDDLIIGATTDKAYVVFGKTNTDAVVLADIDYTSRQWATAAVSNSPYSTAAWSGRQAIGAPDTGLEVGDNQVNHKPERDGNAINLQKDITLTLTYNKKVHIKEVIVRETFGAGTINKLEVMKDGSFVTVYSTSGDKQIGGTITGVQSGKVSDTTITLDKTLDYLSSKIRVTSTTFGQVAKYPSEWNEIDAVQLVSESAPLTKATEDFGFTISGKTTADTTGYIVSSAGDVNGDGLDDLIIGTATNMTYVVLSKADSPDAVQLVGELPFPAGFAIKSGDIANTTAQSVSSAGDVNGDGLDDLIVETTTNTAYVVFGKTNNTDIVYLTAIGKNSYQWAKTATASSQYSTSDWSANQAIGAPDTGLKVGDAEADLKPAWAESQANKQTSNTITLTYDKAVYIKEIIVRETLGVGTISKLEVMKDGSFMTVYSKSGDYQKGGAMTGVQANKVSDTTITLNTALDYLANKIRITTGNSVDEWNEIDAVQLIGVNLPTTEGFAISGRNMADMTGYAVSSAGDVNGDGLSDVLVGASGANATGTQVGKTYVVFGKKDSKQVDLSDIENGVGGFVIFDKNTQDGNGFSVSSAGDVNGDGLDDLLVSTPNSDTNKGSAYIIFGKSNTNNIELLHIGEDDSKYKVNFQGDATNETFTGSSADEIFIAGAGDDILIGNGGMDVFGAGNGNDTIIINDSNIEALNRTGAGNRARVNGGNGTDTLKLDGANLILDLREISNTRIQNIEEINIEGSGNNMLMLVLDDLLAISSSTNTLHILGDTGDTVAAYGFTETATTKTEGGAIYRLYTHNNANAANVKLWIGVDSHIKVEDTNNVASIVITGVAHENNELTADITDLDEVPTTGVTYQWMAAGINIADATDKTYTLTAAEYDKEITVTARFIDRKGIKETPVSAATDKVMDKTDPLPVSWSRSTPNNGTAYIKDETVKVTLTVDENLTLGTTTGSKVTIFGKDFMLDKGTSKDDKLVFTYRVTDKDEINAADFDIDSKADIILNGVTDKAGNLIDFDGISKPVELGKIDTVMTLNIDNTGMTENNGTYTKTSGGGAWNAELYSQQAFTHNGYVIAQLNSASSTTSENGGIMFGLAEQRLDTAAHNIQYRIYIGSGSKLSEVYLGDGREQADRQDINQSYEIGDYIKIERVGTELRYYFITQNQYNNGEKGKLLHTFKNIPATTELHMDSSFYGVSASIKNLQMATVDRVSIDGIAPSVTAVAFVENAKTYEQGETIKIKVTMSEATIVDISSGTPQIALTIGNNNIKYADYISGSGSSNLVFQYTVKLGDNDADGVDIAANALTLNGAIIKDNPGNIATGLTNTALHSNIMINTPPTLESWALNAPQFFGAGQEVKVTLSLSKAVTIDANSASTIEIHNITFDIDTSQSVATNGQLVFTHTVQSGENIIANDFNIDSASDINLTGIADITDPNIAPDLSTATFPIELVVTTNIAQYPNFSITGGVINGSTFTSDNTSGAWGISDARTHYGFNNDGYAIAKINSTGKQMAFGLSVSGSDSNSSYDTIDYAIYIDTNALKIYERGTEVPISSDAGDYSGRYDQGDYIKVERIGTDIKYYFMSATEHSKGDSANWSLLHTTKDTSLGKDLYLDTAFLAQHSSLANMQLYESEWVIDTIAPVVTNVTITTASGNTAGRLSIGDEILVTVFANEKIVVTNPYGNLLAYEIKVGTKPRFASYISGSNTNALKFSYIIQSGDVDASGGITASANALTADQAFTDSAGNHLIFATPEIAENTNTLIIGVQGFAINGEFLTTSAFAGTSVANAGDVNGDGLFDVIIGDTKTHRHYVVFGKTGGQAIDLSDISHQSTTDGFVIKGTTGEGVGYSGDGINDVNDDGLDDLIVSVTTEVGKANKAYVIFGKSNTNVVNVDSMRPQEGFLIAGVATDIGKYLVTSAGDINGDGTGDMMVNAAGDATHLGKSYVIFGGHDKSTINLAEVAQGKNGFVITGIARGGQGGIFAANAGDVNGDGITDLIIGASHSNGGNGVNSGISYVAFGTKSTRAIDLSTIIADDSTAGFVIKGASAGDFSGYVVSSAGDINGDGVADMVIGAYETDSAGNKAGKNYVVFGKTINTTVELSEIEKGKGGFVIYDKAKADFSHHTIANAGDVNGDGLADLLIGDQHATADGKKWSGKSYVVLGKRHLTHAMSLVSIDEDIGTGGFVIRGEAAGDQSGNAVSAAGDVNGDGLSDFIVGAYQAKVGFKSGAFSGMGGGDAITLIVGKGYVIFGKTDTNAIELSKVITGEDSSIPTIMGTRHDSKLVGTSKSEIFVANRGDDVLQGNGGADVFHGGLGNDSILINDSNIAAMSLGVTDALLAGIHGGDGNDTVKLDGSGLTLDLTRIANSRFTGIEKIDLTGSGNNTLKLELSDLIDSFGANNLLADNRLLKVLGNRGDTVEMASAGFVKSDKGGSEGAVTYDIYTNPSYAHFGAGATMWIDVNLTVHMPSPDSLS
ncbi:MAG: hypothetical protein FE834_10490 [Gammaproteobacteria bacterium]|nr:hypothetical protein [Gammaproteobacteria bacterium]